MKLSFTKTWTVILSLLALTFSAIGATPAHAASLVVNSLSDTTAVDGNCTLREAITNANANSDTTGGDCVASSGADTITFSVSGTITLVGSQLPNITAAGGALTIDGTGKTVTISGNNAVRVAVVDAGASLTLNNLTIANGIATGDYGGGINNLGTLSITNSTFSNNSADLGTSGGISNTDSGTVTLRNTIVANSVGAGNCSGTITNGGNNIDDGATCGWVSASGSMRNTNPLLGALANNGGPTQTLALLTGSPAIDGVTFNAPNGAPSTDQRGIARPQGTRYDIGSYELFTPTKVGLPWLFLLLGD
jgi:CSLREA domain-containing protein